MKFKKVLALLMCLNLGLSAIPATVYAAEDSIEFSSDAEELTQEITDDSEETDEVDDESVQTPGTNEIVLEQDEEQPLEEAGSEIDILDDEESEEAEQIHIGITAAETENGIERKRTGWTNTENGKKYILTDGSFAVGLAEIDGEQYMFDENGIAVSGWFEHDGAEMYALNGGLVATGIIEIGDDFYAFDENGYLLTGWIEEGGKAYFADESGKFKKDWFESEGRKYYAAENGVVDYGWIICGDKVYYQTESGVLTGVQNIDGVTYVFGESGARGHGMLFINGFRYYCDEEGCPVSGWLNLDGKIAYSEDDGCLYLGWHEIDGKTYYFGSDGFALTGMQNVDGEIVYFAEDGSLMMGKAESAGGVDSFVSVTYEGAVYEGEVPDRSKLKVSVTGNPFVEDENIDFTLVGDNWDEPVFEETELLVDTILGQYSITIVPVSVDHVEARYRDRVNSGEKLIYQNIAAYVVYEDGRKKSISDFVCDLSAPAEEGNVYRVMSDYGNADLIYEIEKPEGIHAEYNGFVYFGDKTDSDKIRLWVTDADGRRIYIDDFKADETVIYEDTDINVVSGGHSVKCRVKCIDVESVRVSGFLYAGDILKTKNLCVRFSDGASRILKPGEYEWEDGTPADPLSEGTVNTAVTYLGKRFSVTAEVKPVQAISVDTMVFGGQPFGNGVYVDTNYTTRTSLGIWTLTAYADTPEDQGKYVGQTASGAPLVEGRTVAVSSATMNRLGLSFGDRLEINGHVYVIEDHGGSAMDNRDWVDIFVANPEREYDPEFNTPSEVFLLR